METVQYVANEAGAGIVIAIGAITIAIWLFFVAWTGTLSEDAQRRNIKRSKGEKRQ